MIEKIRKAAIDYFEKKEKEDMLQEKSGNNAEAYAEYKVASVEADKAYKRLSALENAYVNDRKNFQYFSYDNQDGFYFFNTEEAARQFALEELEKFREDAFGEGEWDPYVEEIYYGVLLGKVAKRNGDYDLE